MISWNNNYYQILDKNNSIKQIYKGTKIQVFENVLTKVVRIKYYNIFYETKKLKVIDKIQQKDVKWEEIIKNNLNKV